jgi:hypothetical protein
VSVFWVWGYFQKGDFAGVLMVGGWVIIRIVACFRNKAFPMEERRRKVQHTTALHIVSQLKCHT